MNELNIEKRVVKTIGVSGSLLSKSIIQSDQIFSGFFSCFCPYLAIFCGIVDSQSLSEACIKAEMLLVSSRVGTFCRSSNDDMV